MYFDKKKKRLVSLKYTGHFAHTACTEFHPVRDVDKSRGKKETERHHVPHHSIQNSKETNSVFISALPEGSKPSPEAEAGPNPSPNHCADWKASVSWTSVNPSVSLVRSR